MQIWEPEKLVVSLRITKSASGEDQKEVRCQPRRTSRVVRVVFVTCISIYAEKERCSKYVLDNLKLINEYYVTKVTENCSARKLLERYV